MTAILVPGWNSALRRPDRRGGACAHPLRGHHRAADRPVPHLDRAGAAGHGHLAARTVYRHQRGHRRRAPNIAVGDVLGSCVFNLVMLVLLDELSRGEPMYRRIDQGQS